MTNEPASLLLILTPDKRIVVAGITLNPEKDFPHFTDINTHLIGKYDHAHPQNWFLRLDYKHLIDIPPIGNLDFSQQIQQSLARGEAKVKKILTLFDVFFCRQRGRDPLAPENRHDILVQDMDYSSELYELIPAEDPRHNMLQGIRTDRGLHLFSVDNAGDRALKNCLHYYGSHFFDKQRGTDRLDLVLLNTLGETPQTLGNECKEMFNYKPLDLPATFFCHDPSLIELVERRFDMLPTLANMRSLQNIGGVAETDYDSQNHSFMRLAMLHSGQCTNTDDLPLHPFTEFAFEDTFRDLMREREADVSGSNAESIAARVRERAGQLLETQFPHLRYCREPEQIEAQLREQNPDQAVCPERQRRGPKL